MLVPRAYEKSNAVSNAIEQIVSVFLRSGYQRVLTRSRVTTGSSVASGFCPSCVTKACCTS